MPRISNIGGSSGGGSGSTAWGAITGTLASQTDLQSALDAKQPLDSDLTTLAGLTATTDNFIVSVASAWASRTPAQVRTTLGLVIGTNVQAFDAELAALAGLTSAADSLPYFTGSGTAALATLTTFGRSLIDDANAAAGIATLGLDADLATFALPASTTISAFGATIIDDANAAATIATLGLDADLATFALPASTTISTFGATLVDDADAATARTTLGLVAAGAGDIWVEKAGDTMTGQLFIDGGSDTIQQLVQANATQTSNLAVWETSAGTDLVTITGAGLVGIGITPTGAQLQVKATTGSIAKFGDAGSDARFELLRDTGGGAVMVFDAGDAIMRSGGNWQLQHAGASKIKLKNDSNGKEVWIDTTTPSIYTGGGDDLWLGRNATQMLTFSTTGTAVTGAFQCDSIINDTGLAAGTYTPTLTNVANLAASTAYECQYLRVGNTVTVSGKVDIDPTLAATSTQLGISLPVASNIGAAEDCSGVAFASGIAGQGAAILGDAANDRAQLQYVSADVSNQAMFFTFTYQVI